MKTNKLKNLFVSTFLSLLALTAGPIVSHGEDLQCPGNAVEEVKDECSFASKTEGQKLFLSIGEQNFAIPLDSMNHILNTQSKEYEYNEKDFTLTLTTLKGSKIWIHIDPKGKYPSKITLEKHFANKVCPLYDFNYSYTKGEARLGRTFKLNGGFIFGKYATPENPKNESYIIRSKNLEFDQFEQLGDKMESKGFSPIVSSKCLKKFGPEISKLSCADPNYQQKIQEIREKIAKSKSCAPFLYVNKEAKAGMAAENSPMVIHLHASGFGGPDGRGNYALEELKLATVFGYRFLHPYHKENPTPLTGSDVLRPIFFQKGEKEERTISAPEIQNGKPITVSSSKIFDFEKHDEMIKNIYQEFGNDPKVLREKLMAVMDKFHFYHPISMEKFLSKEAKSCFDLSPQLIEERQKNSLKFSGGHQGLFDILETIVDEHSPKVLFHCHGGRHKTGVLALAIRYLEDPRWYYGPKERLSFGIKKDEHSGEENLSWGSSDKAFYERYKFQKKGKEEEGFHNIIDLIFQPEKGTFNPAETEYINHNGGQVRLSNLKSTNDLFKLLFEPENTNHRNYMMDKYNLSAEKLKEIELKLLSLQEKMQKKISGK